MSLLFQHPALFGLLALAGLPVLVHLLSLAQSGNNLVLSYAVIPEPRAACSAVWVC